MRIEYDVVGGYSVWNGFGCLNGYGLLNGVSAQHLFEIMGRSKGFAVVMKQFVLNQLA